MKFSMDKATLIRTLVLAIALINQALVAFGLSPVPFTPAEIEAGLSTLFTVLATIWVWWKNNSVTNEAKEADKYLVELKRKKGDK